jgi:hypothetical protein
MVDPTREILRRVDRVEAEAGVRGGSDGYERRARERRLDVADGGAGERLLDVAVGEGELPGRRGVGALVDDGVGDVVPPRTRVDGRDREAGLSPAARTATLAATGSPFAIRTANTFFAPPPKARSSARVRVSGCASTIGAANESYAPNRSSASE